MKNNKEIYENLKQKYTLEEFSESMFVPAGLSPEEKLKADEELREFRFKLLRERTEKQRFFSDLMRLKYQM